MQQGDAWLLSTAAAPPPPLLDDGAPNGGGGGSLAHTQDAAARRSYSANVGALLSNAAEAWVWQPAGAAANPGERIASPSDDNERALTLANALHGACVMPTRGESYASAAVGAGMPPAAAEARAQPPQTGVAAASAQPAALKAANPPPGHAAAGGAGLEAEAEASPQARGHNPLAWQAPQLPACRPLVDYDDDFVDTGDDIAAAPPAAPPKPALAPAAPLRVRSPGPAAPESLIGCDVRVRYPTGMYDGRISDTRYLAKDGRLWRVLFTDGSEDELTWSKIAKGLEAAEAAAATAAGAAQRAPRPVPEAVLPAAARVRVTQQLHKSARPRSSLAAPSPLGRAKQSPVPRALLELLPPTGAGRGRSKPKLGTGAMGLAERVKLRRGDGADAAPSPMRAARPGVASVSRADAGPAVVDMRRPLAGQRVCIRSLSGRHGSWLEGTVQERSTSGHYNVWFDDGTTRARVPVDELRRGVLPPALEARSPEDGAASGELRSPGDRGGGSAFSSPRSSPVQRKRARSPDAAAEPRTQARSGSDDNAEPHAAPDEDLDDSRRAEVEQVQAFLRSISPPLSQLDAAVAVVAASGIMLAQLTVVHRVSDELRPLFVATAMEGLRITRAADKLNFIAALDMLAPKAAADVADEEEA